MISVVLAAAIVLVLTLAVLAIDWERIKHGLSVAFGNVNVEGGWRGLRDGLFVVCGIAVIVACFFTGLVVIGQSLWGLA